MEVKCPRCKDEFGIDDLVYGDDVKCQKCGLLIDTESDDFWNGEDEFYSEWSNDTPAACCEACENLNLESCVGICRVDS
jgi:hypothetical protein